MSAMISCQDLLVLLASDRLFAVFDVRERGEFNECQIINATSLPRSQIEFRIASLIPDRRIPIVVYDEGGERAVLAARTLSELGYEQVSVMEGGLAAWRRQDRPTVSGVNVPSKAFGERVHHERNIPDISPEELKALQESPADLAILDARTPEEYGRFRIPGGVNVPGGDLILWAEELRHKPMVVVNCAGRTRSIIGTAALRRLGLTNARALSNGTMGWVLAGLELESKPVRQASMAPAASRAKATALALRLAEEEGILWVSADEVMRIAEPSSDRAAYLIDVRSESEYESGHVAGSLHVPGGQAVQRADDFVAVRNGKIVFISNESARAVMAAYWYRQMGFRDVLILRGGLEAWRAIGGPVIAGAEKSEPLGFEQAKRGVRLWAPAQAQSRVHNSAATILDVGTSVEYEAAHLPGAKWMSRGWLELKLPSRLPEKNTPILVTCPDGQQSVFAARTLAESAYSNVSALEGGVKAWRAAGYDTKNGMTVCWSEVNDVVLSPSITGGKGEMRRYLDWEVKLKH